MSREDQDRFATESQRRAKVAVDEDHFAAEIVPVSVPGRKGAVTVVDKDEHPKPETTIMGLSKLRPAFKNVST